MALPSHFLIIIGNKIKKFPLQEIIKNSKHEIKPFRYSVFLIINCSAMLHYFSIFGNTLKQLPKFCQQSVIFLAVLRPFSSLKGLDKLFLT